MKEEYLAIGETAGKIYRALEKSGKNDGLSLDSIKKQIEVADSTLVNQALGWLAREEKIDFQKNGKTLKILLVRS